MEIRNLKVENLNRCLQDFVLHLLNNDIVPVDSDENVPCAQLNRLSPAFHRRAERVLRCTIDGFSLNGYIYNQSKTSVNFTANGEKYSSMS